MQTPNAHQRPDGTRDDRFRLMRHTSHNQTVDLWNS
jgi:hypothetical protein